MAAAAPTSTRGEIITFYSYKGGTGRTMALANVACLLAERVGPARQILVVDWDLEAPGLHRFILPRLVQSKGSTDLGLDATPGVIDLFTALHEALPSKPPESEEAADFVVEKAFSSVELQSFIAETAVPGVRILRAGRDDDGQYSRRVSTFNWEDLFRRGPTIYRAFAERIANLFPYVLIDSRTGLSDISGICTSLLPEKLVVVFTPNRQSLTGVRDLVERATSYRRKSDDLRPLLVYPLPSRIEGSLERMRDLWRFGDRDQDIIGYQPMFEGLLGKTYGLGTCNLKAYFTAVQIQQTPDYAYGEQIAVLRESDRLSLGNSFRVFVDRLVSSAPPWEREEVPRPVATSSGATPSPAPASKAAAAEPQAPTAPQATAPAGSAAPQGVALSDRAEQKLRVFLSYARPDRERVAAIASALESRGFEVWLDRDIPGGVRYDQAVAEALDSSDVVIVCWSRASVVSDAVLAEAGEGLRRGVLIPALLDDVAPPIAFRSISSADMRRDFQRGLGDLVDAVADVAGRAPGTIVSAVPPPMAPRSMRSLSRSLLLWGAIGAGLMVIASSLFVFRSVQHAIDAFPVPNFVNSQTADCVKTADLLGLRLVFKNEQGQTSDSLQGLVVSQVPAAEVKVARGAVVELTVATSLTTVPVVVGMTLDAALPALSKAHLHLTAKESRVVPDAKPGTIIDQLPQAGTSVAEGTEVRVVVATGAVLGKLLRHNGAVNSAQFSPDGQRIVTASADNTQVWDARTGELVMSRRQAGAVNGTVNSAQFSPDGQRIVTASTDNTAQVWDARTGAPVGEPLRHDGVVSSAQFSPDGQRIVTASTDKTAQVWDARTGARVGEPLRHHGVVNSAQFSPDGQHIVTASADKTARVWGARTGARVGEPLRHHGAVNSAQFSPDGQRIVTASADNTAQVWDARTGAPIGEPLRHNGAVNSAQFSPDGQRIVTASTDNTAQVWDARAGARVGEPLRHDGAVNSAQFSPDGQRIVTASNDRTARVWARSP